eukprot:gene3578-3917_t
MTSSEDSSVRFPSELRLSKQWDFTLEQFATKTTIGFAAAGLASIVLFRGRTARFGLAMFGAGVGAGDAYRVSSIQFDNEKSAAAAAK